MKHCAVFGSLKQVFPSGVGGVKETALKGELILDFIRLTQHNSTCMLMLLCIRWMFKKSTVRSKVCCMSLKGDNVSIAFTKLVSNSSIGPKNVFKDFLSYCLNS